MYGMSYTRRHKARTKTPAREYKDIYIYAMMVALPFLSFFFFPCAPYTFPFFTLIFISFSPSSISI